MSSPVSKGLPWDQRYTYLYLRGESHENVWVDWLGTVVAIGADLGYTITHVAAYGRSDHSSDIDTRGYRSFSRTRRRLEERLNAGVGVLGVSIVSTSKDMPSIELDSLFHASRNVKEGRAELSVLSIKEAPLEQWHAIREKLGRFISWRVGALVNATRSQCHSLSVGSRTPAGDLKVIEKWTRE